jgi:hypothetical protein
MTATATHRTVATAPVHQHVHDDRGVDHGHPDGEAGTSLDEAASSASVALDIGAGRGALVIYPSERFRGLEIEISPVDGNGHRVHTGVHERTTQTGSMLTAVFGSLPAADYLVWEDSTTDGPLVRVPDGAVAELRLN